MHKPCDESQKELEINKFEMQNASLIRSENIPKGCSLLAYLRFKYKTTNHVNLGLEETCSGIVLVNSR